MDIATCVVQRDDYIPCIFLDLPGVQDLYDALSIKGIAFVDAVAETQCMECFGLVNA